ncbi:hypothetical protein BMETH_321250225651680, partial [methanotrophic bacterial endosymbiont of Bathymodiolus sp.]
KRNTPTGVGKTTQGSLKTHM